MATDPSLIADGAFWRRPLAERMAIFAEWRAQSPLLRLCMDAPAFRRKVEFTAVIGHPEVSGISRRCQDFSGQASASIGDLPGDIVEYFSSILATDGPRHTRQRQVISPWLSANHIKTQADLLERDCAEVLDGICERGEVDLVSSVAEPFTLLVACDLFGIPRSELPTVGHYATIIAEAAEGAASGREDRTGDIIAARAELSWLLDDVIRYRRKHPAADLTTALLHDGTDRLDPKDLRTFFLLTVTAGSHAPRAAISHGVYLLAFHPEQKAIWQADPVGITPTAVEEILRLVSPVVYMRRTVVRDTTLAGDRLEAGEKLVMFFGAANRDPQVFPDPESMDLRRAPNPHVAFGAPGYRSCLGAHLARAELSVMFRQLLTRFPDLEPVGEAEFPEGRSVPSFEAVGRLGVRFAPHAPRGASSRSK